MRNQVATFLFLMVLGMFGNCNANVPPSNGLQLGCYGSRCPGVEDIVRELTWKNVSANPKLPAKLLRLHFHDCFVRGCDGSVLLDSTPNNQAEKAAPPNLSLSGFDFIDYVKSTLEQMCPGVVSCADIVALVARDAVSYQYKKSMWTVYTGREDGTISSASEASANLPTPFSNFQTLLGDFQNKKLNIVDLVVLSGAHTIGETHCSVMAPRLYNFTTNGGADPSLNAVYAQSLKKICPPPINPATTLGMDPGSSLSFDSHYYVALKQNMGAFESDAALLTNPLTAGMVKLLQNPRLFFPAFNQSIVKMGAIGVLTNGQGQIRKNCRVVNP